MLFQGTLEKGETQRFAAKRLWFNVGTPENLALHARRTGATLGTGCPQVVTRHAQAGDLEVHCG